MSAAAFGQQESNDVALKFSLSADPVTVTISGHVTDARTGRPIEGAVVRALIDVALYCADRAHMPCGETKSDAGGGYHFTFPTLLTATGPGAGSDTAYVSASMQGYETRVTVLKPHVTPEKTAFAGVDFALGEGMRLSGKVVDSSGAVVGDAIVQPITEAIDPWICFALFGKPVTESDGGFGLWAPKDLSGAYAPKGLMASKRGMGFVLSTDLRRGDLGTLTLTGAKLIGRVVNEQDKGIAGWEVKASREGMFEYRDAVRTDAEGEYRFDGAPLAKTIRDFYATLFQRSNWHGSSDVVVIAGKRVSEKGELGPRCSIALESSSVRAPDIIVGPSAGVNGILKPGANSFSLEGMVVRLADGFAAGATAIVDANGRFHLDVSLAPGKRTLVACLPWDANSEKGVGSATFKVGERGKSDPVELQIATLAEVRVRYVDAAGNPLEGVQSLAAADALARNSAGATHGTISDSDGWSTLYLYPGGSQSVMGADIRGRGLVESEYGRVASAPGKPVASVHVTMVPAASISGRVVKAGGVPVAGTALTWTLGYADGTTMQVSVMTDDEGRFAGDRAGVLVRPGVVTLSLLSADGKLSSERSQAVVLVSGETKNLGDVTVSGAQAPSQ